MATSPPDRVTLPDSEAADDILMVRLIWLVFCGAFDEDVRFPETFVETVMEGLITGLVGVPLSVGTILNVRLPLAPAATEAKD